MKKSLNVLMLVIALVAVQACGSKSKETKDISTVSVTGKNVVMTSAEKKARLEKERTERAEQRRTELEKLVKTQLTYIDAKGNIVYNKAEEDPLFSGGDGAMVQYLRDNLKFPEEARKKDLEGTVFVDFVIGKNGIVREVAVTDEIYSEVDMSFIHEAIRVVTSMPKWQPGRQHGKPVDVKFSIPITFEMI